jgi:hypothetical protein
LVRIICNATANSGLPDSTITDATAMAPECIYTDHCHDGNNISKCRRWATYNSCSYNKNYKMCKLTLNYFHVQIDHVSNLSSSSSSSLSEDSAYLQITSKV